MLLYPIKRSSAGKESLIMLDLLSDSVPSALRWELCLCVRIVADDCTAHSELARARLASLNIVSSQQVLVCLAGTKNICGFAVNCIVSCQ